MKKHLKVKQCFVSRDCLQGLKDRFWRVCELEMAGWGNGWEVWKFLGWILSSLSALAGARMKKKKGLYPINYCQTSAQMSTLALTVCSASLLPRGGQKVLSTILFQLCTFCQVCCQGQKKGGIRWILLRIDYDVGGTTSTDPFSFSHSCSLALSLLARSPREKEVVGGVIRFGADNNTLKSPDH